MYKLLRPKVLLFFAVSIMSFYITSEKSYAAATITHSSSYGYVDSAKDTFVFVGSYCKYLLSQVLDYCYSVFKPHGVACLPAGQDVKIQIMGKHVEEVDDEDLGDEGEFEQDDECPAGDLMCEKNLNFFNQTYFTGLMSLNDKNPADIDKRDNEYRRMRMLQLKLLYGQDESK